MPWTDVRNMTDIWVVIRRSGPEEIDSHDGLARYMIQGLATTESIAVAMCRDETYYIGPMPVNYALPHERCEWPGLYCPLMKVEDEPASTTS